ncbi:MAG: serine/threonine-protein kinase [Planctomycetota bacterium]|nr:serine/threonine-protein kinase [Planctomycetota bacterium]
MPKQIGHYRLRQVIGSGGMAVVYLAVQEHPRRTVALKLMKSGVTSRSALRRFEYESQILARLRHPNIAQVYEAGTHDDGTGGVPFFAMEYIAGARAITDYANEKSLGTRQRLELFAQVCDAVHHGHQKGIIHRDLKPGNILVDSSGEVKIIDFGVARATDSDMAVTTLQTDIGQLVGTVQYMSPEQCAADPADLDTRSDVYALGVVLFELLCRQLPYDVTRVAIHEAARMIREQTPARPSTINRTLRGDLETITLKAMEKERDRRYQSAGELAKDIQRYLNEEAIEARPPSVMYQLRVFARRHRAAFGAVVTVFAILLLATVLSLLFAVQANTARREAVLAERQAVLATEAARRERDSATAEAEKRRLAEEEALQLAEEAEAARAAEAEQRKRAEREAALAREINTFLTDMLAAANPWTEQPMADVARDVRVVDVLAAASSELEGRFEDDPLVEASIRITLGNTYRGLGDLASARPHLERALQIRRRDLGEEDPDTLSAMSSLAELYQDQGRLEEVEPLFVKTLRIRRRTLGEEHIDTLGSMHNLAELYWNQGRYEEVEPLFERTLEIRRRTLGEDHRDTLASMNNLAMLRDVQGRDAEAETLFRQTLEGKRRALGEDDPDTLATMNNLALFYNSRGRREEAEPLYLKTLSIIRRVLGENHPHTIRAMNNLALLYRGQERYGEAEPLYMDALQRSRDVLGEQHASTLIAMMNLGVLRAEMGRYEEAEPLLADAIAGARTVFPGGHAFTGVALTKYGGCLMRLQCYEDAETALNEAFEMLGTIHGPEHRRTTRAVSALVELYETWGRPEQAASWRGKLPDDEAYSSAGEQER